MFVCKKCGSTKIEQKEWVEVNTGKTKGLVDDSSIGYCLDCDSECTIINKEDYEK